MWKPVIQYENLYEISDTGLIASLNYKKTEKRKLLHPGNNGRGYARVFLSKNKKCKAFLLHRLVWEAFNGPIPEGMQVNHINENKLDNRLVNLNLMTSKENNNWGSRKELFHSLSKPILQFDKSGNLLKRWSSMTEIKNNSHFHPSAIRRCLRGEANFSYNCIWKYE